MSSGVQHKLYNHEVLPPEGTWQKIAAELDDSALSHQFPSKLYQAMVTPPVHTWQQIAAALDEPVLVGDYSSKLAGLEVMPPAAAWNKITDALDSVTSAPERKVRTLVNWPKYAAAAAIIGILAWGGLKLLNNGSGDKAVAQQEILLPASEETAGELSNAFDESIPVHDMAASIQEARNDAALEASKKTFAKLDVASTKRKIKNAAGFIFNAAGYEPDLTRGFDPGQEETTGMDISNRYIILMTPDGNIIRMSKKLKELVCCVSGEEQDKDCIDQMKKWRERLANPSATHSSSNFMDILSLMNCMEENN